ncbi:hypothetical protein [Fibrella forsythiae]|uniref:Glycosyltransferase RgtA/B/C/D-like domain-containing protein n=1 Tax=Fibrella forsythiae TaxID=2817061 RepID=A0ABS3JET3_9BACT|nr:hypothetical protein [Fibrella forsythiae]MBO0948515.1 hypothetical protein [Fibrella forsythiae]
MFSSPTTSRLSISLDSLPSSRWSYLIVGLAISFACWVSFIQPPDGGYFTTDEQFIADSGVFMLFGATPRCLDWPGIPMVLVFYLLALGQCLINIVTAAKTGGLTAAGLFEVVDKTAYAYLLDRVPLITAGRLVQILLVGSLLIWCVRIIHRSSSALLPPVLRLPLVIILCLQFDVFVSTPVIRPEGLSYALFAVASLLILFSEFPAGSWRKPALVLLLIALLISQRLLFMFTFPFLLGGVLLRMGWSWQRAVGLLGALLLFMLLTMPFLWTDSFVLLKAFAGGMLMKVSGTQTSFFNWGYVTGMVLPAPTVWQLVLIPIGALAFWRWYPNKGIAALLIGNLVLLTVSIFHSSTIYITHTLPLRTMSLFMLVYAGYGVYQITSRRWVLYGLAGALALSNFIEGLMLEIDLLRPSMLWQTAAFLRTLPGNTPVLINPEFDNVMPRSRQTSIRELKLSEDESITQAKYDRQFRGQVSNPPPVSLRTSLSEDEQLNSLQRRVLAQYTPPDKYPDLSFFGDIVGFVNYYVDQKVAMVDFEKGKYAYLITKDGTLTYPRVAQFDKPSHSGPFYVYKTPATPVTP